MESLGFGTEVTEVVIESQGHGYVTPVEIYVVDGRPQPSEANFWGGFFGPVAEHPFLDLNQVYREAQFEVNATDENGSILDLRIVDGGAGYEPTFFDFFTGTISNTSGLARIVVRGGGGNGALIFGEVNATGSVSDVFVIEGGSGYYNFDINNTVRASITPLLLIKMQVYL